MARCCSWLHSAGVDDTDFMLHFREKSYQIKACGLRVAGNQVSSVDDFCEQKVLTRPSAPTHCMRHNFPCEIVDRQNNRQMIRQTKRDTVRGSPKYVRIYLCACISRFWEKRHTEPRFGLFIEDLLLFEERIEIWVERFWQKNSRREFVFRQMYECFAQHSTNA